MRNKRLILNIIIATILLSAGSFVFVTDNAGAVGVCNITVGVSETPDLGTQFPFSAPPPGPGDFTLGSGEQEVFNELLFGDEVTITEQVPSGWVLNSVTCDVTGGNFSPIIIDVENGVTIDCEGEAPPGQDPEESDITCLFVNSLIGRNIPTISEWGLIAMAGILGIAGFMAVRRRKVTA